MPAKDFFKGVPKLLVEKEFPDVKKEGLVKMA
jgi:hypothetical protein